VLAGVTGLEETVRLEFERVLGRAKAAGDVGGIFSGFEGGAGNPGREGVVVAVQPSYVGALIRMVMDERRRQEGGRR
jgi:hypothetical protein